MHHTNPLASIEGKTFVKPYTVKWANDIAFFMWESHAVTFARNATHNALITIYRKDVIVNTYQNGKLKRRFK